MGGEESISPGSSLLPVRSSRTTPARRCGFANQRGAEMEGADIETAAERGRAEGGGAAETEGKEGAAEGGGRTRERANAWGIARPMEGEGGDHILAGEDAQTAGEDGTHQTSGARNLLVFH